jgi:hypothetical protein
MNVGEMVVADAVGKINVGAAAVIVPERTIGEGYCSSVRTFERSFYEGHDSIEAARFYRADIFYALGGFDEHLTGPEDWDLTIRARELGSIDRIEGWIEHDEGGVRYSGACQERAHYAQGLRRLGGKCGMSAVAKVGGQPSLRHPQRIASRPRVGLVALKLGETAAVSSALLKARVDPGENSAKRATDT